MSILSRAFKHQPVYTKIAICGMLNAIKSKTTLVEFNTIDHAALLKSSIKHLHTLDVTLLPEVNQINQHCPTVSAMQECKADDN